MHLRRHMDGDRMILMDGEDEILSIQSVMNDNIVDITLKGSMRSDTKNDLWDHTKVLLSFGLNLRMNMKDVTHMSSSCEQVLLDLQRLIDDHNKGSMVLYAVPNDIMNHWKQIGFSDLFIIEE